MLFSTFVSIYLIVELVSNLSSYNQFKFFEKIFMKQIPWKRKLLRNLTRKLHSISGLISPRYKTFYVSTVLDEQRYSPS